MQTAGVESLVATSIGKRNCAKHKHNIVIFLPFRVSVNLVKDENGKKNALSLSVTLALSHVLNEADKNGRTYTITRLLTVKYV